MKKSLQIIDQAISQHNNYCLAYSGGNDSTILLDILTRYANIKLPVVTVINGMEYPETEEHCRSVCKAYQQQIFIARPQRPYLEQWRNHGWPFMGKLGARNWSAKNSQIMGFKLDVSSCCQNQKINPGRKMTKQLRCTLQFTGMRGGEDDLLRGIREKKDGEYYYNKSAGIHVCNPLTGWTDAMCRRYMAAHNLPQHPARKRGATAIGCIVCGGGSNFEDSMSRIIRKIYPDIWRKNIIQNESGLIILALKYKKPLPVIRETVSDLGGLEYLADHSPWIFDYTSYTPHVHSAT